MSTENGELRRRLGLKHAVKVRKNDSNVLILVDGVPTTLDGLGSIPAANVQSIDIVTSPDAKYDAEGTGGIISITSKRQIQEAFTALASGICTMVWSFSTMMSLSRLRPLAFQVLLL